MGWQRGGGTLSLAQGGTMRAIDTTVNQIFAAWPELCGFSVEQIEGELCLADVATDPWHTRSEDLPGEIAAALVELIDEEPEAAHLLRGRTFARTLH
jgi:hypothetical protein